MNKGLWYAMILGVFGAAGVANIAEGWAAQQISDSGYIDFHAFPQVSQGHIVWNEYRDNVYQVFFWDGAAIRRLSDENNTCGEPYISGDYVAWTEFISDGYQVKQFNGSTVVQISAATTSCNNLRLSGPKAVWVEDSGKIILWNGTSRQVLGTNSCWSPVIDGDYVAWIQNTTPSKIYLWDGTTTTQIAQSTMSLDNLLLSDEQMIWLEKGSSDFPEGRVIIWDGNSVEQLSVSSNCTQPCLSDGHAAWIENNQIMYWDGTSVSALTANSKEKLSVSISGSRVVWNEKPSFLPVYLVYMRDEDGTVRFIDMPGSYAPAVDGEDVVWIAYDEDYNWQVFMGQPGQQQLAVPGDINNDQKVDLLDFSILASNWLKGC